MNQTAQLNFDLDDLPVDVFDLDGTGLTIDSLTAGHGMGELNASLACGCGPCATACACSSCPPEAL
jgi:hypothetical protein